MTERKDLGPVQDKEVASASGAVVPAEAVEIGETSKMDQDNERDPLEKRAWVTMDPTGGTGYVTIDDSFADLMSHHTVEVAADGKPVNVQPFVYVDE